MAQFKRGAPNFFTHPPPPDNILMELRFQENTDISILALTQTTDWVVASALLTDVFDRLLLGIFPFIVQVMDCSNETPHSPVFCTHKLGKQFRGL